MATSTDSAAVAAMPAGPAAAAAGAATLRMGPLVGLAEVLGELGFEPRTVLGEVGFTPAFFTDPDVPIPYATGSRLLRHCASVTGCEHLGLLLGERAGADIMGLPGLLLMSAKDVRTGLRDLVRYMDLHDRGAVLTLQEHGDVARLGYTITGEAEGADQAYDVAMAVACNVMRSLCGRSWNPGEVLLRRRRPADASPWRRHFTAPVRFEAEHCGLQFPVHWLARSLPAANPALHQFLQKEADRLQSLLGKGLVDEVRRIVQGMVSSPPCSAARVAGMLGIHERTLHRRLQACGTRFGQVREDVLYGMSRQMLGATSMRVADVAVALGYAEASAFIHAFARWAGQTPNQWRRAEGRAVGKRR